MEVRSQEELLLPGNAFGTTNLNSIVFANGSQYIQVAGANPFGAGAPSSVVVFQTGSLYKFTGAGITPSFAGRTYADVEFAGSGTSSPTGSLAVVMDNLKVTSGTVNVNLTGTSGHSIKGNISVATGATLTFSPASAATMNLNGTSGQTISGSGTLTINSNQTISVSNSGRRHSAEKCCNQRPVQCADWRGASMRNQRALR
jgi:hypothetical protein